MQGTLAIDARVLVSGSQRRARARRCAGLVARIERHGQVICAAVEEVPDFRGDNCEEFAMGRVGIG